MLKSIIEDDDIHTETLYSEHASGVSIPAYDHGQTDQMLRQENRLIASDLGRDEALIEAEVPKEWVGKRLADLHLSRESGLTILAVKPKGKSGTITGGDTVLEEGDVIVVEGTKKVLDRSPLVRPEGR